MKLSDPVSETVKAGIRKEQLQTFFAVEAAEGRAISGLYVDASLEAATAYLVGSVGKEAAYNTLQRFADEAAGALLENAARHQ
jgi:hypothetical protein